MSQNIKQYVSFKFKCYAINIVLRVINSCKIDNDTAVLYARA